MSKNQNGKFQIGTFFLGAFLFLAAGLAARAEVADTVHFLVNTSLRGVEISPFIYGINAPLDGAYSDLMLTRLGGNRWTAYNWTNNASNAGMDWNFQNDGFLGGGDAPGGAVLPAMKNAAERNAGIIVTVPMAGYVAADKNGDGDVRKSGPDYLHERFRRSLPRKGAEFELVPDAGGAVYQDEFINWLLHQKGIGMINDDHSCDSRPVFIELDNEPDLWASTHAEIHPGNPTYEEVVRKTVDYSLAIKHVAPDAIIFGPVNYGWQGFIRLQSAPDSGGRDFQEYYLACMRSADEHYNRRLLDVFDVHWYPEALGGGKRIVSNDAAAEVAAARMQAPRSLWDPTYKETSWITEESTHGPIGLIPRLKKKIDQYYPGTKLAITEYNYGGGKDISGGIAEADVLGIFGREGVFAACQWPMSGDQPFIAAAFRMFVNFDGKRSNFGDESLNATTDRPAETSIYASIANTHTNAFPAYVALVALNKTTRPINAVFSFSRLTPGASVEIYQLTGAGPSPRLTGTTSIPDPQNFPYELPALSVSTLKISEH